VGSAVGRQVAPIAVLAVDNVVSKVSKLAPSGQKVGRKMRVETNATLPVELHDAIIGTEYYTICDDDRCCHNSHPASYSTSVLEVEAKTVKVPEWARSSDQKESATLVTHQGKNWVILEDASNLSWPDDRIVSVAPEDLGDFIAPPPQRHRGGYR
jgi:hypothetical protein